MANRYWIGGTGNWSSNLHWSDASGGTAGAGEVLTNGSFTGNANGWTLTGWTYGSNQIAFDQSTYSDVVQQNLTIDNSTTYIVTFTCTIAATGLLTIWIENDGGAIGWGDYTTSGTYQKAFTQNTGANPRLKFWSGGANVAITLDNISCKKACVPTSSDAAIFDANSGSGTMTVDASSSCASLDASATSVTTFAGSAALAIAGNFTLKASMTISSWTSVISITGTGNVTTAANTVAFNLKVNGSGITVTLADNYSSGASTTTIIELTQGTLDTNGKTVTVGQLYDNYSSSAHGLTLGASTINLKSSSWVGMGGTNVTITPGTSTIKLDATAPSFYGGGKTYNNVEYTGVTGTSYIYGANTFNNLTITGGAASSGRFRVGGTQTITGTLTINGNSVANRILVYTSSLSYSRSLVAAAVSLSNVDFSCIDASGAAAPFTGTSLGNSGRCSGITFTAAATRYWVGNGGNWSDTAHWSTSSGGATGASVPLPQDTVVFDANSITSGGQTITLDVPQIPGLDFTNIANSPTLTSALTLIFMAGSLKFIVAMTVTLPNTEFNTFYDGDINITTNGHDPNSLYLRSGGTVKFLDDLSLTTGNNEYLAFIEGIFDCNDKNITAGDIDIDWAGSTMTVYMKNSVFTVLWDFYMLSSTSGNLTLYPGNSLIVIGGDGVYFYGGYERTLNDIRIDYDTTRFWDEFHCNLMVFNNAGNATGTYFGGYENKYVRGFRAIGSSGNLIRIRARYAGETANIVKEGGGRVKCDFLEIQDLDVSGGKGWYAGANSTNTSGNNGWIFTAPPKLIFDPLGGNGIVPGKRL